MSGDPVEAPSDVSRREMMKRVALAGGTLIWAVPVVQSLTPPAFASTSPTGCLITINGQMEHPNILPGDQLQGGFHIKIDGSHVATTVTATNMTVTIHAFCPPSNPTTFFDIVIPIPDYTVTIPANNTNWFPAQDEHDPLVWQGTVTAPANPCGSGVYHADSATFQGTFVVNPATVQVKVQFHYRNNTPPRNTSGSWSSNATACP